MSFLKNRTVVGVICILLSLLICFGLTPLFNQSVSQKAEIVRVVQPIRAGDEITESMVQIVEVGGYNLPEDVLRQKESAVVNTLLRIWLWATISSLPNSQTPQQRKTPTCTAWTGASRPSPCPSKFCGGALRQAAERRHCVGDRPGLQAAGPDRCPR